MLRWQYLPGDRCMRDQPAAQRGTSPLRGRMVRAAQAAQRRSRSFHVSKDCASSDNVTVTVSTPTRYHHFLAIAEQGSYRRAAAALHLTQPALSKSIQALEAEIGHRLFDRESRGVQLTEFGRRVLCHAKQMVAAEQDLRHDLELIETLSTGQLRVALGPYPSVVSGYRAAMRLARQHPHLNVALQVANWRVVTAAVVSRQADLGLAELTDAIDHPELQTERVGQHRAHFFCRAGHPILQHPSCTWAELLQYPWATTRIPPRITQGLPADLGRAGRRDAATGDLVPAIELDVPMLLAGFATGSDALVVGALSWLEPDLAAGRVCVVPLAAPPLIGEYGFIWARHRSLSRAAQAYIAAVREEECAYIAQEARAAALHGPARAVATAPVEP
jgi:DNA-binding transcriptional LysR family regulator